MPQKLKLAIKPTFAAPVLMRVPGDGQVEEVRFDAVFKRLTKTENDTLQRRLDDRSLNDRELLDMVLADWKGLAGDDGLPFICTPRTVPRRWRNGRASRRPSPTATSSTRTRPP